MKKRAATGSDCIAPGSGFSMICSGNWSESNHCYVPCTSATLPCLTGTTCHSFSGGAGYCG